MSSRAVAGVGFDCGSTAEALKNLCNQAALPYPLISDVKKVYYTNYGAAVGYSTYLILDASGVIRYRQTGADGHKLYLALQGVVMQ